jgi:hypothetical protein
MEVFMKKVIMAALAIATPTVTQAGNGSDVYWATVAGVRAPSHEHGWEPSRYERYYDHRLFQAQTKLGRTKREKNPQDRYQYCGVGIGWVKFGVSCDSQQAPTPTRSMVLNGTTFDCRDERGKQVCVER